MAIYAKIFGDSTADPKFLAVTDNSRFIKMEYLNVETLKPSDCLPLQELTALLVKLHNEPLPEILKKKPSFIDKFKVQVEELRGKRLWDNSFINWEVLDSFSYEPTEEYSATISESGCIIALPIFFMSWCIWERKPKIKDDYCLIQQNFHRDNLMRIDGELRLVDYEMAAVDHPFLDLASFAMHENLDLEEERALINAYLEAAPGLKLNSDKAWRMYLYIRAAPYINKGLECLLRAFDERYHPDGVATRADYKRIFDEETVMSFHDGVQWVYSHKKRSADDDLRFARSAFEKADLKNKIH